MPADASGRDENAFGFTDEDFARRYAIERAVPRAARPDEPPVASGVPPKPPARPLHGGGNSFMRARRRRLASRGI